MAELSGGSLKMAIDVEKFPNKRATRVAVKMLKDGATDDDKQEFYNEAEMMVRFNHENCVRMIGVALQQRPWLMVIEFIHYGDLQQMLKTMYKMGCSYMYNEQIDLGRQVAAGMNCMHEQGFVHMDLAARNVLVAKGGIYKVADFGLTHEVDADTGTVKLSGDVKLPIKWLAMESLRQKTFSRATDVWALGITLWEVLAYGKTPYPGVKNKEVLPMLKEGRRMEKPRDLELEPTPDELFDSIITPCWDTDPSKRPTMKQISQNCESLFERVKNDFGSPRDIGETIALYKQF
jgi:serine/threonine protein kinase